jgi:LysM repeat protein
MKKTLFILVVLAVLLGGVFSPAAAAPEASGCRAVHKVVEGDTLNYITEKYDVQLDYLVKYNAIYKDAPGKNNRRSIYVGQKICIPKGAPAWNEKKPTWAEWPASNYTARLSGKTLYLKTTWFNYPSTYYVKIGSEKVYLLKIKYHATNVSFPIPAGLTSAKQVCLKNVSSDALVCRPILK